MWDSKKTFVLFCAMKATINSNPEDAVFIKVVNTSNPFIYAKLYLTILAPSSGLYINRPTFKTNNNITTSKLFK